MLFFSHCVVLDANGTRFASQNSLVFSEMNVHATVLHNSSLFHQLNLEHLLCYTNASCFIVKMNLLLGFKWFFIK